MHISENGMLGLALVHATAQSACHELGAGVVLGWPLARQAVEDLDHLADRLIVATK